MKTRYPFKWKGSVPTYVPPKKPQYGYLRTFVTPLRHTPGKLVMRPGRCYVDRYGYLFPMVHPKGPPEFPQPRYTGRTPHPPSNPPKWGDIGFRKMRARAAIQQTVG
ncbi:hypothetical protein LSAT2_006982 [Lamellibrachia satsuma]|nr:hypothetical protein LSAT2_006982 [Lamellibrachia satsuma]